MKITKNEVKTIFLALLISLSIYLTILAIHFLWLHFSSREVQVHLPNRVEELQEISQLPLEQRRKLILTGIWGEEYYTNIIQTRRINQSPWHLVSFGAVRPNTSYDLLALTALLLQTYPHIAMDRDVYLQILPGGLFFDIMEYHVTVQNMAFLYPYGIEVSVIRMQGLINGVIVDEIIDFR